VEIKNFVIDFGMSRR